MFKEEYYINHNLWEQEEKSGREGERPGSRINPSDLWSSHVSLNKSSESLMGQRVFTDKLQMYAAWYTSARLQNSHINIPTSLK